VCPLGAGGVSVEAVWGVGGEWRIGCCWEWGWSVRREWRIVAVGSGVDVSVGSGVLVAVGGRRC